MFKNPEIVLKIITILGSLIIVTVITFSFITDPVATTIVLLLSGLIMSLILYNRLKNKTGNCYYSVSKQHINLKFY